MSLQLLEENWESIESKVIYPLWKYKFCSLYQSVKMDKDDFESLAGEVLTKAFKNYDFNESNIFTYSKMVLTNKARTEVRDRKREKRRAELVTDSLEQKAGKDYDTPLEEILEDVRESNTAEAFELEVAILVINKYLQKKEQTVINLLLRGYNCKDISKMLNLDKDYIQNMKKKLNGNSSIRRVVRKLGYLGGTEE